MSIVIPTSKAQLDHAANAIMRGIHDIFPADIINSNGPISEKKMIKGEAQNRTFKTLIGFDFGGKQKTMWLEEEKRAKLLTTQRDGSGPANANAVFRSVSSIQSRRNYAMPSSQSKAERDCYPHATGSAASDRWWYISIGTPPSSRQ